jgi:uncharacterized membrane protein YozB (DUF420 family)
MYNFVLAVHNILRWVIVILAIVALYRAYRGWLGNGAWTEADRKTGLFFTISMDVQLLLGLILYFALSPLTQAALDDFGAAMGSAELRFFALEHLLYMLLALVLAHVGNGGARRFEEATKKHRWAAILFSLAVLAILLGMPWARPLLPGIG